jgi:hypothetical protein
MLINELSTETYDSFFLSTEREEQPSSKTDRKTRAVFENNRLRTSSSVAASWGGQLDLEARWGGNDGVQGSIGASGKIEDDKGNSAELEVKQNSDGSGSANISVSHTEKEDK